MRGDLTELKAITRLAESVTEPWGHVDALINNASIFLPSLLGTVTEVQWHGLLDTNLKAPFFLSQALASTLLARQGAIVNVADIHGEKPLKGYAVYSIAKAGLLMLTRALARELGPQVRVNAVVPGAVLWPKDMDQNLQCHILDRTVLKRPGSPEDVARAIRFLLRDAGYMTGQVLTIDGGRSIKS